MGNVDWQYTRQSIGTADVGLEEPIDGTPERIASVYRARAKKLAETQQTVRAIFTMAPILVFRLGKQRYGIELASVSAVLGAMRTTPVPESEGKLEGLLNVNGNIRPVLNLRFLLNQPPASQDTPEYFLLLRQKQRELGVKVEEIERISAFAPEELDGTNGDGVARYVRGSTADGLTMLRGSALFAEFWNERLES
jgi:chemotaxis signal transduction protein